MSAVSDFSHTPKAPWAVFGVALVFRLLYLLQATDNPLLYIPQLDEEFYVDFGKQLLAQDGHIENQGFFMDPLYGYFLSGVFYLFGDNLIVPRLLQITTDSVAALLLCLAGRRLWSPYTGLIAGFIYALYPVCWFYSLTLLKTTFTTDFAVLFSYLLICILQRQTPRNWFTLGVITGIGVYLRANLVLLLPFTFFLPLIRRQHTLRKALLFSGCYVLGASLILGAVGIINKSVFNHFAILPLTGGVTLYGANNPGNPNGENANPDFVTKNHPSELFTQYKAEAERRLSRSLSDADVSSYWRSEAVKYWFSSTSVLPDLFLHKIRYLISHDEIANNQSIATAARFAPMLLPQIPVFSFALAIGLPGILLATRKDPRAVALLPVMGVVAVTSLLYFSSSRFRMPLVPVLILGSAYFLAHAWHRAERIKKFVLVLSAATILLLSLYSNGPKVNVLQQEINLALAHAELGQTNEALVLLTNLEKDYGSQSYYQRIRAYVSLLAKDYDAAYHYTTLALQQDPTDYGTMNLAGIAALERRDYQNALGLFSEALRVSNDDEFHYWIGKTQAAMGNSATAEQHLLQAIKQLPPASPIAIKAKTLLDQLQRQ